jgi:rSAM/selenodomain-associated transferase 2
MLSIIIPALNEARALPATLEAVVRQQGDFEVLVVDGGSIDGTPTIAGAVRGIRVLSAAQGRGAQMNAGAEAAQGELLMFLHADTLLAPGAVALLNRLEQDPDFTSGGFRHRFSGTHPALRFVSWLHNFRCRMTRVFYGDQAMIVRRSVFESLGGFPTELMEDIRLSETLREKGEPRLLDLEVVTDSRKFEQMGPWRSLLRCLLIISCYELRLPIMGRAFFAPIR